jgi:hypothetical protein
MPPIIKNHNGLLRPNYFDRQRLTADDLMTAQRYLLARQRRHNRYLHGWGVTCGLDVRPAHLSVAGVRIYYLYRGGNVNLTINGDFRNLRDLNLLDGMTVGDVLVTVEIFSTTPRIESLVLTGPIRTLALGGQELQLFHIRTRETTDGPETSFSFNDLTLGAEYMVGDLLTVEGLPLNIQPFTWLSEMIYSDGFARVNSFFTSFGQNAIEVNNVNLGFNFTRSCTVEIDAGYFVTPNGDEVHVPEATVYDLSDLIEACVSGETPCSDPRDLDDGDRFDVGEGFPVRIVLTCDDLGGNENLEVNGDFRNVGSLTELFDTTIGGTRVIGTDVPDSAVLVFQLEGTIRSLAVGGQELQLRSIEVTYPDGTVRSTAFDDVAPDHQFRVGDRLESGDLSMEMRAFQWWNGQYTENGSSYASQSGVFLNNINLALSFVVATDVYLIAHYQELAICPTPAVPGDCQPINDVFNARVCETYAIDVICDLPLLHQPEEDCEAAMALVCGTSTVPCPPDPGDAGNYVVLARITVDRTRDWDSSMIDTSIRRRLLSAEHVQAMLRCLCRSEG